MVRAGVVSALLVLVAVGPAAFGAPGATGGDVTVTAAPRWGPVAPGSWTPYRVTLHNGGGGDVDGEVVLVPQAKPAPKPGSPAVPPRGSSLAPYVYALGGRAVTAPLPRGPGASTRAPSWPSYRTPFSLPAGSDKALSVMVEEAPFGYRVELREHAGRLLADAAGPVPVGGPLVAGSNGPVPGPDRSVSLLLLSDVAGADVTLEALPQDLLNGADVIQLRSVQEFPSAALELAGLDAVVIDDFNTSTLTTEQRRALADYVSLGGRLLLGGGAAWSRTISSLPEGLTPLRPTSVVTASLAPLADLVGHTSTLTAAVATGTMAAGRAVLGAPGGPPLLVEAGYGSGSVVQLAYDPLAEPFASDHLLQSLAWDQGAARVIWQFGSLIASGGSPPVVPEDQVWRPVLGSEPWPAWPLWGMAGMALYSLLVGPATLLAARRARRRAAWAVLPVVVALAATMALGAGAARHDAFESAVRVRVIGADGAMLTTVYRGVTQLDPHQTLPGSPQSALSSVFTASPLFRNPRQGQEDPIPQLFGPAPVAYGPGGGAVRTAGRSPGLSLAARPWALRTVQSVSVDHGGPALEAALRLVLDSPGSPGRLIGTVTNRGTVPVHHLGAQMLNRQARLTEVLAPAATAQVDAPVEWVIDSTRRDLAPATRDDSVMYAVANSALTAPGQVAVVGVTDESQRELSVLVVAVAVELQASQSVPMGTGGRLVATSPEGGRSFVIDLAAPAGTGPLSIDYLAAAAPAGQLPTGSDEVYSWRTGSWRSLPLTGRPNYAHIEAPLQDAEVNDGLVRFRVQGGAGGPDHLVLSGGGEGHTP